ncbi:MAG: hypothetical protein OXG37_12365 [Actinomycetia bacterium]|nr:hypothetical protein [Actinomycetes bacterium]
MIEIELAAAVSLHRVEANVERRDVLTAVRSADGPWMERSTASGLDWISSVHR